MVYYKIGEEVLGEPSLKVDENQERFSKKLSEITGITQDKLEFFLQHFGNEIFKDPSIMGVTEEQAQRLKEFLILMEGFKDEPT